MSYAAQIASARALVARKGSPVTVRRTSHAYDPIAQTSTPAAATAATVGVALPPGRSAEFEIGSLVGRDVTEFWLSPAGALGPVEPGDELEWAGGTWKAFWTQTYAPDGVPIITKAYAER